MTQSPKTEDRTGSNAKDGANAEATPTADKPATQSAGPVKKTGMTGKKPTKGAASGNRAAARRATPAKETSAKTGGEATGKTPESPANAAVAPSVATESPAKPAKPAKRSEAAPSQKVEPAGPAAGAASLTGPDYGLALVEHGLGHLQRTATSWMRYCETLACAQSGMDVLQANEAFIRDRYDEVARDSIASATLLLETGHEVADRVLSGR